MRASLAAYAHGTMPESEALLIATHMTLCGRCRAHVADLEAVGGVIMDDLELVDTADDGLDRLLSIIDAGMDTSIDGPAAHEAPKARMDNPAFPEPLQSYVNMSADNVQWRRLAPGVKQVQIETAGFGQARLLQIAPSTYIPHHGHGGRELTLILSGSYSDELGRFQAGDVADLDIDIEHQPIADSDQPCICLIASEAPLKFSGMLSRLVQPFIGL